MGVHLPVASRRGIQPPFWGKPWQEFNQHIKQIRDHCDEVCGLLQKERRLHHLSSSGQGRRKGAGEAMERAQALPRGLHQQGGTHPGPSVPRPQEDLRGHLPQQNQPAYHPYQVPQGDGKVPHRGAKKAGASRGRGAHAPVQSVPRPLRGGKAGKHGQAE